MKIAILKKALLPAYEGFSYGYEMAKATIDYTTATLGIDKIIAITDINNVNSIKLLEKIGLNFEKTLKLPDDDTVLVFG